MFYSQFGDAVEQAIQKLVEPVEKDFKVQLFITFMLRTVVCASLGIKIMY